MSEDLDKPFMYQINWNRRKYPEEIAALEKAKKENGIAWYLRKLIRKDIEERKRRGEKFKTADEIMLDNYVEEDKNKQKVEKEVKKEVRKELIKELKKEPKETKEVEKQVFIDDTGGFL